MDVASLLTESEDAILEDASARLERARLAHYTSAGPEESRRRLETLFDLVVTCLGQRAMTPIIEYVEKIAKERFSAGFDISEVQAAFNVLEEAIWSKVVVGLPPADLTEAAGLVGTVLGFGKDRLACTWVSLAAERHVPTLDLTAMFTGTGG